MNNGKTIGGIIMIAFGAILAMFGFLVASVFFTTVYGVGDETLIDNTIQEKIELFKHNALETTGEITEIDLEADTTTIEYWSEIDDTYYEKKLYTVFSNYSMGDSIEVYYKIDDPSDFMVTEVYNLAADTVGGILTIIGAIAACVGVLGLILLIVGIVLVVKGNKNNQRNNTPVAHIQNGQI